MCKEQSAWKIHHIYTFVTLIAIGLGFLDNSYINICGNLISDVFIKLFKCISLPIISLSIIVTLAGMSSGSQSRSLWIKTLSLTFLTTILAAFVAFGLYKLIAPTPIKMEGVHAIAQEGGKGYLDYLSNLIPSNIIAPFVEHHVMGVLFISIVMGLALRTLSEESEKHSILTFFKGIHGIFMVLTKWVVKGIPIALLGFIITTIQQLKTGSDIKSLFEYLSVVVLANVIQGCIVLPLLLWRKKLNPWTVFKGMLPALSMAFFSKSSAGTLPITIETAEKNLKVRSSVSRFVLPLCTSLNMNGCAAFIFATVIYVMNSHGVETSFSTLFLWVFISTIAAIGNAGVPMGCFFLSASLLTSMDIPITLMGLILPFYSVIDMIETSLNVWSDSCIAVVLDKEAV